MKATRRLKTIWNLTLTVGIVVLVCTLVGWGIYLGDQHRQAILYFESDVLGMKVAGAAAVSPDPSARPAASPRAGSSRRAMPSPPSARPARAAGNPQARSDTGEIATALPQPVAPALAAAPTARRLPAEERSTASIDRDAIRAAAPSAVPEAMAADPMVSMNVPITIRVKVLVDERFAKANAEWISPVQRTMSAAANVYRDNFGIDLSLVGVVKWGDALAGQTADTVYEALRGSPREGADVLLGFLSDQLDAYGYLKSMIPADSPFNGAYGLVGTMPGSDPPHLRGVLRSLGHLLGAQAVIDPKSEAYRLGSWMSDRPVIAGQAPWIDLDNRSRILQRKGRPYLPEPR